VKSASPAHSPPARGADEGGTADERARKPTVRRRRLPPRLRGIRESKGKSAMPSPPPEVVRRLDQPLRTGPDGLRPREVERLLDYYQITGARASFSLGLAEDAAQKGWWEEYADTLSRITSSSSPGARGHLDGPL